MSDSGRKFLRDSALMLVILCLINFATAQENTLQFPMQGNFVPGQICSPSLSGHLTYNARTKSILACNDQRWIYVSGQTQCGAGNYKTCYDVVKAGASYGDGFYFLTEPTSGERYRAYCDMTTEGGGWTLFATKASAGMAPIFVNKAKFHAADAISHDDAGCIPAEVKWEEVLFRFKGDRGASRVVFSRNYGGTSKEKTDIINLFTCGGAYPTKAIGNVGGFYRHSPHISNGKRDPVNNFHTVALIASVSGGFSEHHQGTDKWFDLWNHGDVTGKNYFQTDTSGALGRKCIAGVCYEKDPVWFMYR